MSEPQPTHATAPEPEVRSPFLSRKDGAAELYLMRHADAVPTLEELEAMVSGDYDDQPLSQKGRLQAQALGTRLKSIEFSAIYASPLRRTQETAAPLLESSGLPLQIEPDLREVMFPRQGNLLEKAANKAAAIKALRSRLEMVVRVAATTGKWTGLPGTEESSLFRQRVVHIIDTIAGRHPGERVAIFAHGGVINVYVAALLGLEKDYFYPIYNASICVVRVQPTHDNTSRLLITLNDAAHLQAEPGLLTER